MTKENFDNPGVQLLLAQIYALPIVDYQLEIQEIQADFQTWLFKNFHFTPEQAQYAEQLEPDFLYVLGQQISQAIGNQSPITLKQEPKDDDDGEGKVIETNSVSQTAFTLSGGLKRISSLEIHIRYQS